MKRIIFGSILMLAGILSTALLLAGTMGNDWTSDGKLSAFRTLSINGLLPAFFGFIALAVIGIGIALWGLLKEEHHHHHHHKDED